MYNDPYGLENNDETLLNSDSHLKQESINKFKTYENTRDANLILNRIKNKEIALGNSAVYENTAILENGQYDQPWDLSQIQFQLQEKISQNINLQDPKCSQSQQLTRKIYDRMVQSMYENTDGGGDHSEPIHVKDSDNVCLQDASPREDNLDAIEQFHRMQLLKNQAVPKATIDGYDEPWDLQPHRKDNRGEEGYDKPWDLRPHLKDERPASEYDDPWDEKMKNLQKQFKSVNNMPNNSNKAKNTPNSNQVGLARVNNSKQQPPASKPHRPSSEVLQQPDRPRQHRPADIPSQPSDKARSTGNVNLKMNDIRGHSSRLDAQTPKLISKPSCPPPVHVPNIKSPTSNGLPAVSPLIKNDIRKEGLSNNIGHAKNDKITQQKSSSSSNKVLFDASLSLEQQNWYHGQISRVEAEVLLRPGKEGCFLVRTSESNKKVNSLSVKSTKGFIHMKIIPDKHGKFVLGEYSQPFSSIPQMMLHYSQFKLPIKGAEHISLLYPVNSELL